VDFVFSVQPACAAHRRRGEAGVSGHQLPSTDFKVGSQSFDLVLLVGLVLSASSLSSPPCFQTPLSSSQPHEFATGPPPSLSSAFAGAEEGGGVSSHCLFIGCFRVSLPWRCHGKGSPATAHRRPATGLRPPRYSSSSSLFFPR